MKTRRKAATAAWIRAYRETQAMDIENPWDIEDEDWEEIAAVRRKLGLCR